MYFIVDNENKDDINKHIRFFNSKLLYALLKITQYSPAPRNKNDHKIINLIQIPDLVKDPSDDDIYRYYNITKDEQKLIEQIIIEKPKVKFLSKKKSKL